ADRRQQQFALLWTELVPLGQGFGGGRLRGRGQRREGQGEGQGEQAGAGGHGSLHRKQVGIARGEPDVELGRLVEVVEHRLDAGVGGGGDLRHRRRGGFADRAQAQAEPGAQHQQRGEGRRRQAPAAARGGPGQCRVAAPVELGGGGARHLRQRIGVCPARGLVEAGLARVVGGHRNSSSCLCRASRARNRWVFTE